jgi:hypothetical protein
LRRVIDDIFEDTVPALSFTMNAETWIIATNIVVVSQQTDGVFSDKTGSALINSGNISGYFAGVSFLGAGGAITNNAGHHIVGVGAGIFLGADGETVTNLGSVLGTGGVGVQFGTLSNHVVLNNSGDVYGLDAGVHADSGSEGGTIKQLRPHQVERRGHSCRNRLQPDDQDRQCRRGKNHRLLPRHPN